MEDVVPNSPEFFRQKAHKVAKYCLSRAIKNKGVCPSSTLGYTEEEFRRHITSHPNWEKVKDTDWSIDHVLPIHAFIRNGIFDLKLINCLENLQPISKSENSKKGCDYSIDDLYEFLARKGYRIKKEDLV